MATKRKATPKVTGPFARVESVQMPILVVNKRSYRLGTETDYLFDGVGENSVSTTLEEVFAEADSVADAAQLLRAIADMLEQTLGAEQLFK